METVTLPPCEQSTMLHAAMRVLQRLEEAGYAAYIVGGFVRDMVMHTLGQPGLSHDIDLATNCPLPVLETLFPVCADVGHNREFNILLVECDGFRFEIAQLRASTQRPAGEALHHGHEDLLEDLSVRDFRINAMALKAPEGPHLPDAPDEHAVPLRLYDPFGGRDDLATGRLTCVLDPTTRFMEDPLRMLRAVRFAVRFELQIGTEERAVMRRDAANLAAPAIERIWGELFSMCELDGPHCAAAVAQLAECGLLRRVLPEVDALQRLRHNPLYHPEGSRLDPDSNTLQPGTVFDHVLATLRQNPEQDATLNLALLFHDIGKGLTARKVPNHDWHTFFGHDMEGAPLMRAIGERLRMPKQLVETLVYCIRGHMKAHIFTKMRPHKVLQVVNNPHWPLLRKVHYCDDSCRGERFNPEHWQACMATAETVLARQQAGAAVSGKDVLAVCGMPPGPLVGEVIRHASARLLERERCTPEDIRQELLNAYAKVNQESAKKN